MSRLIAGTLSLATTLSDRLPMAGLTILFATLTAAWLVFLGWAATQLASLF